MSEKALLIAKEEIIRTVQKINPDTTYEEASDLAAELIDIIDWDNSALMHKGISWITEFYLKSQR